MGVIQDKYVGYMERNGLTKKSAQKIADFTREVMFKAYTTSAEEKRKVVMNRVISKMIEGQKAKASRKTPSPQNKANKQMVRKGGKKGKGKPKPKNSGKIAKGQKPRGKETPGKGLPQQRTRNKGQNTDITGVRGVRRSCWDQTGL